jgi:hypothetical protein
MSAPAAIPVIPAQAGIRDGAPAFGRPWIPAFAAMTTF